MKNISTIPPKGTSDWLPSEFAVRHHIFENWRKVCKSFGFEEYLTPLLEYADIYRAKSGEDVGGKELTTLFDRAGRELAIRPEMTPSVTRMVSTIYESTPKPIRYFSIANFFRNEKPQRGRNREFWQLNLDIFGAESLYADIEIIQMGIELVKVFNPPKNSFELRINNRKLINSIINEFLVQSDIDEAEYSNATSEMIRILDKWEKLPEAELEERVLNLGLNVDQFKQIIKIMNSKDANELKEILPSITQTEGMIELDFILSKLKELDLDEYVVFAPNLMRGFDYYDGTVFEVFDLSEKNNRSMFGGGRYNGLASIFGKSSFPAVGSAPGDETTYLFLEEWGLLEGIKNKLESKYYFPIFSDSLRPMQSRIAQTLRAEGINVISGLETESFSKAFKNAEKLQCTDLVIFGEEEANKAIYKVKNLQSGSENLVNL